jgi:predicted SAM-dependent methyltransferase
MNPNQLQKTAGGRVNLHIWRTGVGYPLQKESVYLSEWNNLYFSVLPQPVDSEVLYHDVRQPLPYASNQFDAIYAFHIIEHLSPAEAAGYVAELCRILRPGGICRLSTPDMEDIARNYLTQLEACLKDPNEVNRNRFLWAQIEYYDQMARFESGGTLGAQVLKGNYDEAHIPERYGEVFEEFHPDRAKVIREKLQAQRMERQHDRTTRRSVPEKLLRRAKWTLYRWRLKRAESRLQNDPRKTMEINKWMYDRLSLRLLLEEHGFTDYAIHTCATSDIPDWERFDFDRTADRTRPIEPSLYVEARKPLGAE